MYLLAGIQLVNTHENIPCCMNSKVMLNLIRKQQWFRIDWYRIRAYKQITTTTDTLIDHFWRLFFVDLTGIWIGTDDFIFFFLLNTAIWVGIVFPLILSIMKLTVFMLKRNLRLSVYEIRIFLDTCYLLSFSTFACHALSFISDYTLDLIVM